MENQLTHYIFNEVDVGIYKSTLDGNLLYCNPAFIKILGYDSYDDILAHIKHTNELYCTPNKRITLINEVIKYGKADSISKLKRKDGSIIIGRLNIIRSDNDDNVIFGFIKDITYSYYYNAKLNKSLNSIVKAFTRTIEIRDPYTADHQKAVMRLTMMLCQRLNISKDEQLCMRYTSIMHDIGKIHIPSEILNKSAILSGLEMDMIKLHVEFGYQIIRSINFNCCPSVAEIILQHHERLDGSGYPHGLRSEQICKAAKIIAVADTFDAMCSHRPYRPALGPELALKELNDNKGIKYDTSVVEALNYEYDIKTS